GAQSVRQGGSGRGSRRNTYYARIKPPQMHDVLKRFLAAPPNPEAVVELAEPMVLIPGHYVDLYARDQQGNPIKVEGVGYRVRAPNFSVFTPPQKPGQKGFQSFREIVCSAGPEPHAPQPCIGCFQVDHGAKDAKARDQWAFNVAHLGWYHSHPITGDNGQ